MPVIEAFVKFVRRMSERKKKGKENKRTQKNLCHDSEAFLY